jgi:hypothetical protein
LALALVAFGVVACARSVSPPAPSQASVLRVGDLASMEHTRDAFMARVAEAGVALPYVPGIREWTRPSLMSWREEARVVAVPVWQELSPAQLEVLDGLAGSRAAARELFVWLFRWFFVPHELTHALQTHLDSALGHAASERMANDLAVAFYMERPDGPARLAALERLLTPVVERLPSAGDDASFDAGYETLAREPRRYAAYQLRFVMDSLGRRRSLRVAPIVAELLASAR